MELNPLMPIGAMGTGIVTRLLVGTGVGLLLGIEREVRGSLALLTVVGAAERWLPRSDRGRE